MLKYQEEIIVTAAIVIVLVVIRIIVDRIVVKRILVHNFSKHRKKIVSKLANTIVVLMTTISLISVWSLDPSQVLIFISTILTILGVALFAQWSILSNITAGIILFFDSSIKIGDHISILDKEFNIEGKIDDIEGLFMKIRTSEGKIISIPNVVILQKPVQFHDVPTTDSKTELNED